MGKVNALVASTEQTKKFSKKSSKPQPPPKPNSPQDQYKVKEEDPQLQGHQQIQQGFYTIYNCKRPLGKPPQAVWPPIINHEYNCIESPNGNFHWRFRCESTNAPEDWKLGYPKPGVPSAKTKDKNDIYFGMACKEVDKRKDPCAAEGLEREWKKDRELYDVPGGEDCQEYSDRTLKSSLEECKPKTKNGFLGE